MDSGIYALYWWEQNLVYIGRSTNLTERPKKHIRDLENNRHSNYKVQEAYLKYGAPDFIVLEYCTSDFLNSKEVFWQKEFDSLNTKIGLDIVGAGANGGISYNAVASKYTKYQLLYTFRLLRNWHLSYKDIAEKVGVDHSLCENIVAGISHIWLLEKYPFLNSLIQSRRKLRHSNKKSVGKNNITYTVSDKNGILYTVSNIRGFAKEYNLDQGNFNKLIHGKVSTVKGWKLITA